MLCVTVFSNNRPLLQHAPSLSDRQSDPWPVLDRLLEYLTRLVEIAAGVKHAIDLAAVLRPLLDLVVIALVGIDIWNWPQVGDDDRPPLRLSGRPLQVPQSSSGPRPRCVLRSPLASR